MTRNRVIAVAVALVVAVVVFLLWPAKQTRPEDIIKQKVIQMARAAEKKDLGAIMDNVSDAFSAPQLGGKDQLKGILFVQVMQGTWVRVWPIDTEVTVTAPDAAQMTGKFVLGRSAEAKVENLGKDPTLDVREISATWKKESDGEWRVVSAAHKGVIE